MAIKVTEAIICVNFEDKFSVLKSCSASTMTVLPDEGDGGKPLKHNISILN